MRFLNHRGSAGLLLVLLLVLGVLLISAIDPQFGWRPKTTPYRLANETFTGWAVVAVLAAGLVMLRAGTDFAQAVFGLGFSGFVQGVGIVSGFYWDPGLSVVLVSAALPVQRSCVKTLAQGPLGNTLKFKGSR